MAMKPSSSPDHDHHSIAPASTVATGGLEDEPHAPPKSTPPLVKADKADKAGATRAKARQSGAASQAAGSAAAGKIRHLKKDDGEPLWRKDIQYDFLKAVFDNELPVFTNSYEPQKKQCFADLYIDVMARSSKTSRVLRDKLLSDRDAAKCMAMVCLLVNIGRMNTTLNFFPEMRAQLRTYHSIPSLQAHEDTHDYKQLQDAPRLKSILKGGAEDRPEPQTLDMIKEQEIPRTNPVNLIFVICQSSSKIAELHFPPGVEFFDLVMRTNLDSKSRARAFLWLMWFYLESDFTEEGCEENPFGAGVDYQLDVANQGVPRMIELTEEEEALENVDPEEEIEFGLRKQKHRAGILETDQAQNAVELNIKRARQGGRASAAGLDDGPPSSSLPRMRPTRGESDGDSIASHTPPRPTASRVTTVAVGGSGQQRNIPLAKGTAHAVTDASSPAPAGFGHPQNGGDGAAPRKQRPLTVHQLVVEQIRQQRIDHILDRGIRKKHQELCGKREREGAVARQLKRNRQVTNSLEDSDHEGGAYFFSQIEGEEDDYGEEVGAYCAALRRVERRLNRWSSYTGSTPLGIIRPVKKIKLDAGTNTKTADLDLDGDTEMVDLHEDAGQRTSTNSSINPKRSAAATMTLTVVREKLAAVKTAVPKTAAKSKASGASGRSKAKDKKEDKEKDSEKGKDRQSTPKSKPAAKPAASRSRVKAKSQKEAVQVQSAVDASTLPPPPPPPPPPSQPVLKERRVGGFVAVNSKPIVVPENQGS